MKIAKYCIVHNIKLTIILEETFTHAFIGTFITVQMIYNEENNTVQKLINLSPGRAINWKSAPTEKYNFTAGVISP